MFDDLHEYYLRTNGELKGRKVPSVQVQERMVAQSIGKKHRNLKRENIIVSNHHEFFIAICQTRGHYHLMAGVHDLTTGKKFILLSLGKFQGSFNLIFSDKAHIKPEGFLYNSAENQKENEKKDKHFFNYKAFSITKSQYFDLVFMMNQIQNHPHALPAHAFICDEKKSEEGHLEFKFMNISEIKLARESKVSVRDIDSYHSISLLNNCRDTPTDIIAKIAGKNVVDRIKYLSGFDLPHSGAIQGYNLSSSEPFFILPHSPQDMKMADEKRLDILIIIYTRIEDVLKMKKHSIETIKKFEALKDLYNQVLGSEKPLAEILLLIFRWEDKNSTLIDTSRKRKVKTATRKMLEKIYKKYAPSTSGINPNIYSLFATYGLQAVSALGHVASGSAISKK